MLAEPAASRNVLILFYFIYILSVGDQAGCPTRDLSVLRLTTASG